MKNTEYCGYTGMSGFSVAYEVNRFVDESWVKQKEYLALADEAEMLNRENMRLHLAKYNTEVELKCYQNANYSKKIKDLENLLETYKDAENQLGKKSGTIPMIVHQKVHYVDSIYYTALLKMHQETIESYERLNDRIHNQQRIENSLQSEITRLRRELKEYKRAMRILPKNKNGCIAYSVSNTHVVITKEQYDTYEMFQKENQALREKIVKLEKPKTHKQGVPYFVIEPDTCPLMTDLERLSELDNMVQKAKSRRAEPEPLKGQELTLNWLEEFHEYNVTRWDILKEKLGIHADIKPFRILHKAQLDIKLSLQKGEIPKFKIQVTPEQSEYVQEWIFANGGRWRINSMTSIMETNATCLYLENQQITCNMCNATDEGKYISGFPIITFAQFKEWAKPTEPAKVYSYTDFPCLTVINERSGKRIAVMDSIKEETFLLNYVKVYSYDSKNNLQITNYADRTVDSRGSFNKNIRVIETTIDKLKVGDWWMMKGVVSNSNMVYYNHVSAVTDYEIESQWIRNGDIAKSGYPREFSTPVYKFELK